MQIGRVRIENYKSIQSIDVDFCNLNALVGSNNAGKSTIIKAIDLFFDSSPRVRKEDHYLYDTDRPISIALVFTRLTPIERQEFGSAIKDNALMVAREFGGPNQERGEYFVYTDVMAEFDEFRQESNGTKKRSIYARLRDQFGLPSASGDQMETELKNWEAQNEDQLTFDKVRGFFGAMNVANGKLKKKTAVRLVPAVKDASEEAGDLKKSPVVSLLNDIIKQTFENKEEFTEFIQASNTRLAEITDPKNIPQLSSISSRLTDTLQRYYSDTHLIADLQKANEISVSFPSPLISVQHRGLRVEVGNVGHGLQRAIFFSLVQFLAEETSGDGGENEGRFEEAYSDIILLIEEPEIYQHPIKQLLFYQAFKEITTGFNNISGIRIQIIYTTHSEKFVNIVDVDNIRLISKSDLDGELQTTCRSLSIESFSAGMASHIGADTTPMSRDRFAVGLHIFTREINEGFFADKIVIVEGASDKAILEAAFKRRDIDPYTFGISIVDVGGKTKIDKPLYAFKSLGMIAYPVLDSDEGGKNRNQALKRNRLIQSIAGAPNLTDFPSGVSDYYAAFPGNLEKYISAKIGDLYGDIKQKVCSNFDIAGGEACKSPVAAAAIIEIAISKGVDFSHLDSIVDTVRGL